MYQHTLALAEGAERHPRPGRGRGREVAPPGAGRVAQVGIPGAAKLVRVQTVEEGSRGRRHLPAAARGEGDVAAGPRPGLGRRRPWGRPGDAGQAEAERGQTDRASDEEAAPAGGARERPTHKAWTPPVERWPGPER